MLVPVSSPRRLGLYRGYGVRGAIARIGAACRFLERICGGGGIRTHGSLATSAVFKTAAFDRSATPPCVKTGLSVRQRTPAFAPVHAIGTKDWHHVPGERLTPGSTFGPSAAERGRVLCHTHTITRVHVGSRRRSGTRITPFDPMSRHRSKPLGNDPRADRTDVLEKHPWSLTLFTVMSVISRAGITCMKSFSPTQEQALRELVQDALIDFGYGPRSTKNPPRRVERQPAPIVQIAPTRVWPEDDEVLLTEARVCRALGIGRTTLYALIRAKRLKTVRPGRKPMFKAEDVFAFIDALEEAA